jgi:hypothetical protein
MRLLIPEYVTSLNFGSEWYICLFNRFLKKEPVSGTWMYRHFP